VEHAILPLGRLRPHEKIVSHAKAWRIAASILSTGLIYRPIIVEGETLTIIDGHHRYTALKMLGAKYAPVLLARYHRDIDAIDPPKHTLTVTAPTREEALLTAAETLEKLAGHGPGRTLLECGGARLTLNLDTINAYYAIESLTKRGGTAARGYTVAITLPPLTPKHIVAAGANDERLPPRSTLHRTALKRVLHPVKLKKLL
jgi:hypothetical protein